VKAVYGFSCWLHLFLFLWLY